MTKPSMLLKNIRNCWHWKRNSSFAYFKNAQFLNFSLQGDYIRKETLASIEVSRKDKRILILKYQGFQSRIVSNSDGIFLFPNSYYDDCSIQLLRVTSLSVVSDYLKVMPAANQKMDETILKVLHIYNEQMMQNPEYRAAVEHLEPLQVQYAGKPVGKMMKYLRWRANDLLRRPYHSWLFPISTIKILSERSFCY